MIAVMLLIISVVCFGIAYFVPRLRITFGSISMVSYGMFSGYLLGLHQTLLGLISAVFGLYQVLNIARLIKGRLHEKHMKQALTRGGLGLLIYQAIAVLLSCTLESNHQLNSAVSDVFRWVQFAVACLVLFVIVIRLYSSRTKSLDVFIPDHDLPSVSVLVPARNEDQSLEEALKAIVASDYPKLEVIVLDDNSASRRVSEIVKGFAQDGVRFVQGPPDTEEWLAKNYAYETLAQNASGEYMIFMGSDVRVGISTLRNFVTYAKSTQNEMVSVLPYRSTQGYWLGFFSPLRYLRELVKAPKFFFGSPPALSTMWAIKTSAYRELGGFASVKRTIIPERYFASRCKARGTYAFLRASNWLEVSTAKTLTEQIFTSIRVSYPSEHKKIERSAVSNVAMYVFLAMPFFQFIIELSKGNYTTASVSGATASMLALSHLLIVAVTNSVLWPLSLVNFPYLVIQEIVLNYVSMYRYEFGEVVWKGRKIQAPALEAIPHLPEIKERI